MKYLASLLLSLIIVFGLMPAACATAMDIVPEGKHCGPHGHTRYVVKIKNNTDKTVNPSYFYTYTDTGLKMGWIDIAPGKTGRIVGKIPPNREIAFFGIYKTPFSEKTLLVKKNIKALDCQPA